MYECELCCIYVEEECEHEPDVQQNIELSFGGEFPKLRTIVNPMVDDIKIHEYECDVLPRLHEVGPPLETQTEHEPNHDIKEFETKVFHILIMYLNIVRNNKVFVCLHFYKSYTNVFCELLVGCSVSEHDRVREIDLMLS